MQGLSKVQRMTNQWHPTTIFGKYLLGVMNGPLKFLTARKILPLLNLLAKFKRVLNCSCSPNFCVAHKLAKQVFYFCLCSRKNRKDHSSPLLFGRRFEIYTFRNICCKISCLPASLRIFKNLKNGIIAYF